MKEFGSDFHYIEPVRPPGTTIYDLYPFANYYADGRQALIHLYHSQGWERLWIPEYFCYEVVASLKEAGLKLSFYTDYPGYCFDSQTLEDIQNCGCFRPKDAVLRVNYFGSRSYRSSENLSVAAVVEDHTHDLVGSWAVNSHADWCIASLRKTLPIPEGGILWSPQKKCLPESPKQSNENERIASVRWEAMQLKTLFIKGETVEKSDFRDRFLDTEGFFDTVPVCALDDKSQEYLHSFDIKEWFIKKRDNWELLRSIKKNDIHVFGTEDSGCYPFSLVLVFDSHAERNRVRMSLIERGIYPTVLWRIPLVSDTEVFNFSQVMLSIHCDARYSHDEVLAMKSIIESVF